MVIAIWCRTYRTYLLRIYFAHYTFPLSATFPLRVFSPSSHLPRLSNAHFYKALSSYFPAYLETELSDFDADSYKPISNFASPDLPIVLQLLSKSKSEFSTEDEGLAFLRSSSIPKPTKDLLCSVLWELRRDWESTILAFRWAGDCILESPWACHLMVWRLGKQRKFDMAWMLLRKMHRKSQPTRQGLLIMMESYASANESQKAIKTFHALEKFNVEADSAAFYSLLGALCKNKNFEEAEELLLIKRKFFPLEAAGFNILLDGWCNILVDVIEAKRVWREMAKHCITPDGTSYTYMIGCNAKLGNLFDSLRLYNEMKKRGWTPNLKVYNYLIYVLTREGCLKEAHNILNKIMEVGLQPDMETCNSMILPLCDKHKLDEAREVMKIMTSRGVRPSMEAYHALVKIEDFDGIFKLIEQMRKDGCHPNESIFLLFFNNFFSMGKSEGALRMWSEMRKFDVVPDNMHYITMIEGLVKDGWILKAMEFNDEMKSKGFPADPGLEQLFKGFLSKNKNHWGRGGKEYITGKHKQN